MPEIKHTFTGGKMNKDLDERLVKNGEYRHAMNIQVRTTDSAGQEGGAAGAVQNIKGNVAEAFSPTQTWFSDVSGPVSASIPDAFPNCVGSVADEKTNKAYYFMASKLIAPKNFYVDNGTAGSDALGQRVYADYIVEVDEFNDSSLVVVDIFGVLAKSADFLTPGSLGTGTNINGFNELSAYITSPQGRSYKNILRPGMTMRILSESGDDLLTDPAGVIGVTTDDDGTLRILLDRVVSISGYEGSTFSVVGMHYYLFEAERVLNFNPGTLFTGNSSHLNTINGINIIDDLLLWTDGYSEPKKINIERCKAGTNIDGYSNNGFVHTKLYVEDPSTEVLVNVSDLSDGIGSNPIKTDLLEKHVAVLRQAPKTPPTLEMRSSDRPFGETNIQVTGVVLNEATITQQGGIDENSLLVIGDIKVLTPAGDGFKNTQFRKNDILVFTSSLNPDITFTCNFVCYEDDEGNETLSNQKNIRVIIISGNAGITVNMSTWDVSLELSKPLFELKLVRFGYRYKYEDGEYSAFSPWSELAFLPDRFDYKISKAYNLGMVNTIRHLAIKDFIPVNIPEDVKSVDVLYKSTDSSNVYVVSSIDRGKDNEWDYFTPNKDSSDIKTGYLSITSEMIHRVLDSNQILRAWDNVPRKALSQEIVGNRVVYGNYLQGYNLNGPINLTQTIESNDSANINNPKKSIKSLRDYKIGVVFGDKYGRETPVITPGYSSTIDAEGEIYDSLTGDISVEKTLCALQNNFVVSQNWSDDEPPADWIDYVKYYVKETSNEYYNLIMDRWYDAGDENIWISFNSSDRNKVDEETYLILKNRHGEEEPVLEKARYKIIAIENEAPDFVKTKYLRLGFIGHPNDETTGIGVGGLDATNTTGIWLTGDANSNPPAGLVQGGTRFKIAANTWNNYFNTESDEGIFGRKIEGLVEFRIIGYHAGEANGSAATCPIRYTRKSAWRTLSNWRLTDSNSNVEVAWTDPFAENDINHYQFFCECDATCDDDGDSVADDSNCSDPYITSGAWAADFPTASWLKDYLVYTIEFREAVVQHKPEYDGKFFVKIEKDQALAQGVMVLGQSIEYQSDGEYDLSYISSSSQNEATVGDHANDEATFSLDPAATNPVDNGANWFFGAFDGITDIWSSVDDSPGEYTFTEDEDPDFFDDAVLSFTSDSTFNFVDEGAYYVWDPDSITSTLLGAEWYQQGTIQIYDTILGSDAVTLIPSMSQINSGSYNTSLIGANGGPVMGSCTWQHNEMTRAFWRSYSVSKQTTNASGATVPTSHAFIDGAKARRMIFPNETGFSPAGGNFYEPESLSDGGASNGTKGEITISAVKSTQYGAQTNEFIGKITTIDQLFQFEGDSDIYKVIRVNEATEVKNYSRNITQPVWFGYTMEFYQPNEDTGCAPCDMVEELTMADGQPGGPVTDNPYVCERRSYRIHFRKIDQDTNTLTNLGLDISSYDPRGRMKHDGSESIKIKFLTVQTVSYETINPDAQKGACFETEPKEDVGLDLYYEASKAIPMRINSTNMYDYMPINSKVKVNREIDGVMTPVELGENYDNHRVKNLYFTSEDNRAIVAIVSDWNYDGRTELHRHEILIGDELVFEHGDGTETKTVIKDLYSPVDGVAYDPASNNLSGFPALTDEDKSGGLTSTPKTFIKEGDRECEVILTSTGNLLAQYNSNAVQWGDVITGVSQYYNTTSGISYTTQGACEVAALDGEVCEYNFTNITPTYVFSFIEWDAENPIASPDSFYPVSIITPGVTPIGSISAITASGIELTPPGNSTSVRFNFHFKRITGYYGVEIETWNKPVKLPWFNCYSFGNGVESDRIRDDYNAPQLDNGVKVSTTFSGYKEENISSGLIYSGLYNSTSQINNLNEFNMAEKITKELNPSYGSIQTMKTRDTDVVVFTEDKVLKVLASKDALFNADGNPQLTATDKVLGTAIPFVGDYGISQNPESLAADQYRMYFTDKQRGAVLRLSRDGLTPISDVGMKTWFRDNMRRTESLLGSFDKVSGEYNLSLRHQKSFQNFNTTVSFNEAAKGWVSFKSFVPSQGLSIAGKYYTTNRNTIFEHYRSKTSANESIPRNQFYGQVFDSELTVSFNDLPSTVKSFKTINYEGSQARINEFQGTVQDVTTGKMNYVQEVIPVGYETTEVALNDKEYYNLNQKDGWWVSLAKTDLETGKVNEFIKKEGKWFNKINGSNSGIVTDPSQFLVQGIGMAAQVIVTDCTGAECDETGYIVGCTDPMADNFNEMLPADIDDGSCLYNVQGCTDPAAPNYNPIASIEDGSCDSYVIGCQDENATNYNANATQDGYLTDFGELTSGGVVTWTEVYSWSCLFCQNIIVNDDGEEECGPLVECEDCFEEGEEQIGCMDNNYEFYNPAATTSCADADGDGVPDCCGELVVIQENEVGCVEPQACNYNSLATIQGVCNYDCWGCMDPTALNYNSDATLDCSSLTEDQIQAIADYSSAPANFCAPCEYDGDSGNELLYGCMDENDVNYDPNATVECIDCSACVCCEGSVDCDPAVEDCGGDGIIEGCTDGSMNSMGEYLCSNYNPLATIDDGSCNCVTYVPGCTDPTALNYSPDATDDDGSCVAVVPGCMDITAFNFDPLANEDDGSCQSIIYGCTDETAYNYDPLANTNETSANNPENPCIPFVYGCMDSTATNYEELANSPCDGCIIPGSSDDVDGLAIQYGCEYPAEVSDLTVQNYGDDSEAATNYD